MRMGDVVYDVDVSDADNDAIVYKMFTEPASDFFEIGYADGSIRVTHDLRQLCEDDVTFEVMAEDPIHSPQGPATIQGVLRRRNHPPVISNTQTEIEVKENKHVSLDIEADDVEGDDVTFKMRARPIRGLEYYSINKKGTITSIKPLDYENELLRTVDLYVDVRDGFCDAETFCVTVRITDENEPPVIKPDYVEVMVYEGFVSADPGWTVLDPDREKSLEWTAVSGGGGQLVIDKATGFIHSIGEIDIDPKTEETFTFKVQVKDKGSLKDTAVLRLKVVDKNDNVPHFQNRFVYKFTASPCTKPGAILGTVHARDKDSHLMGNHHLVYSGWSQNMSVLAAGDIILTAQCTPGDLETFQAYVTDQGSYPGPLEGIPTTVTVHCNECLEPITTIATIEATTENTTSSPAYVQSYNLDGLASNLGWILPTLLLASSLAGLIFYVTYFHCCRACAKWRAQRALQKRCPKQTKEKQKQTRSPRGVSVEGKPTAPVLPPVETEPFLFGFWKETFADRDQRHMPRRDVIPASVEQDRLTELMEKKKKEKEKEKRRLERLIIEEKYRTELEKYHQHIRTVGINSQEQNCSSVALPPSKRMSAVF